MVKGVQKFPKYPLSSYVKKTPALSQTSKRKTKAGIRKIDSKKHALKEYRIVIKLPADTKGQIQVVQGPRLWNDKGQKLFFSARDRQVLGVWVHNAGHLPQGYIDTVVGYTKKNDPCQINYKKVLETMSYMRENPLSPTPPKPKKSNKTKTKRLRRGR
jgi:hypothetical protein